MLTDHLTILHAKRDESKIAQITSISPRTDVQRDVCHKP